MRLSEQPIWPRHQSGDERKAGATVPNPPPRLDREYLPQALDQAMIMAPTIVPAMLSSPPMITIGNT